MRRRLSTPEVDQNKKRIASNGHRLPDPIGLGEILTDTQQNQWKIGNSIGLGGFGEIYLASDDVTKPVGSESKYAVKVEPHDNGPLFVEMNFYIRAAKPEQITRWSKHLKVKKLGMPCYVASGSHMYKGMRYRFLVLERYGEDLSKVFLRHRKQFHIKTAFTLATQILDNLEYIHSQGYIHADIKASNLLLGRKDDNNQVYLLDYGLACHYLETDGTHKPYSSDERKAHRGTIEFTSRDAHIGALSRRGDLEILAYNVLQWLCGKLPWEKHVESPELVHEQKQAFMTNIPELLRACCHKTRPPQALNSYLRYVASMPFDAKPDYAYCRKLFRQGIRDAGYVDDGVLEFNDPESIPKAKKAKKRVGNHRVLADPENICPRKRQAVAVTGLPRQPCEVRNCNRMTRKATSPVMRWFQQQLKHDPARPPNKTKTRPKSPVHPAPQDDDDFALPGYVHRNTHEARVETQAMRDVMARRWREDAGHKKKSKRDSANDTLLQMPYGFPTPEMMRIIKRYSKPCPQEELAASAPRNTQRCKQKAQPASSKGNTQPCKQVVRLSTGSAKRSTLRRRQKVSYYSAERNTVQCKQEVPSASATCDTRPCLQEVSTVSAKRSTQSSRQVVNLLTVSAKRNSRKCLQEVSTGVAKRSTLRCRQKVSYYSAERSTVQCKQKVSTVSSKCDIQPRLQVVPSASAKHNTVRCQLSVRKVSTTSATCDTQPCRQLVPSASAKRSTVRCKRKVTTASAKRNSQLCLKEVSTASAKVKDALLVLRSGRTRLSTPIVMNRTKKPTVKSPAKVKSVISSRKASIKRCLRRR